MWGSQATGGHRVITSSLQPFLVQNSSNSCCRQAARKDEGESTEPPSSALSSCHSQAPGWHCVLGRWLLKTGLATVARHGGRRSSFSTMMRGRKDTGKGRETKDGSLHSLERHAWGTFLEVFQSSKA